jgi:hypothetical protein
MTRSYYPRRPPSPRKGINWKFWASVIAAAITAVGYIIVALVNKWPPFPLGATLTPTVTHATALPPELKIMSVQEKHSTPLRLESINGTYDRVPEGQQIWLIVMANNLCYPQNGPAQMLRAGIWEHGPVEFPAEGEQQLRAAMVSPEGAVELRSAVGREPIRCDRPGVEFIDSVTVIATSSPVTLPAAASPAAEEPWVEILEPSDRLIVQQRKVAPVHGRYRGFEQGDQLWLVVFVGANFYVQNGPALLTPANGTWIHADIYVGEEGRLPEPKQFAIVPVVVHTPEDQGWFRERKTGMAVEGLPEGVTILPRTTVMRTE